MSLSEVPAALSHTWGRGMASEAAWTLHSTFLGAEGEPTVASSALGTHTSLLLLSSSLQPWEKAPPFFCFFPKYFFLGEIHAPT